MSDYTDLPFGNRPLRVEMRVNGQRVVKWITPRQMGMDETTIEAMEAQEDNAEVERAARLRKAS